MTISTRQVWVVLGSVLCLAVAAAGQSPEKPASGEDPKPKPKRVEVKELPPVKTDNKNTLIQKYHKDLKLTSSSIWEGWPESHAFDGILETSWFTARGDAAAHGKKPWLQVTFPEDIAVRRVTVLGNRDPHWLTGYTILAGGLELLDKDGKRLKFEDNEGLGNFRDFEFKYVKPIEKVRSIRFISLGDQGDQNPYDDIAIAEIQVE